MTAYAYDLIRGLIESISRYFYINVNNRWRDAPHTSYARARSQNSGACKMTAYANDLIRGALESFSRDA